MKSDLRVDAFSSARERMVRTQLRDRVIRDPRVLQAMATVPRHEFVSEDLRGEAYEDHPLPIGEEQTVSQPFIVALMLQELALRPDDRVLEIGTGSGYQTALLSGMVTRVYSMERRGTLAQKAEIVLSRLGCGNVQVIVGDGSRGLPEFAPYDAIIVSAGAAQIPPALPQQLAEGGRMVIPVGPASLQELQLVRKLAGDLVIRSLDGCRFVPLVTDP